MYRWLRVLVMGDGFYLMAFGLLTPIFAIFLTERIPGANPLTVGLAEAVYLVAIALLRPFSQLYGRNDASGWRVQHLLWFGTAFVMLTPLLYLLSRDMVDVYVIQLLYGTGIAFCQPAWSRLMDKTCTIEATASLDRYNTLGSLLAAGMALIGGFVAQLKGIAWLLIYLNCTIILAAIILLALYSRFGLQAKHKLRAPHKAIS